MLEISHAVIQLPGAFFYVRSPGWRTSRSTTVHAGRSCPAWHSGKVAIGDADWRCAHRRIYGWRWQAARSTTTLTVLPLNGGHAVFVQSGKSGDDLLMDCGDTNAVDFITKPFLHAQGVNRLPQLVLTQGDIRDVGGAQPLCDLFAVGQVITSPVRFRSPVYRQTIAARSGRQTGTGLSLAAMPSARGKCCIPLLRINSPKPTTVRW